MKQEVNSKTAFIVIGIILALVVGGGIYYFRQGSPTVDPQSPQALQSTQQVNQDYSGQGGRRPPPGTAGNPIR